MTPRFLLVVRAGRSGPPPGDIPKVMGLGEALEAPGFVLLLGPGTRAIALGNSGLVVGSLFHRHGPARPISTLPAAESDQIIATGGDKLLDRYWGGYVALVESGGARRLLRDPSGALPCYTARHGDHLLAASDVELLLASGLLEPSVDWNALGLHLYSAGLPTRRTVLAGINELLPGFSVDLGGTADQEQPCWSPWDHVRDGGEPDRREFADHLRRTIVHCVRGWTASSTRLLLSVSGGLDSSIVAACLADAGGPETHCLTMFSNDAAGDERSYARALCAGLNLPLQEHLYRVEEVDIDAPLGGHLPRPFGRSQSHAYERAHLEAAAAVGADGFITGNGGDNVFGYSQSAAAIADCYLCEGFGGGLLSTVRDVCRQTGCSALVAIRAAVRILRSPRPYSWRPSPTFLHPDVIRQLASAPLEHAWLDAPPGALPGKAGHIAGLLRVQPNLEPGRARYAPVLNPLLSQPIVELSLSIPSWQWRTGGRDRAIVRDAFREELPDVIVKRRSKGGPDGFTAQLIVRNRSKIAERLINGRLASKGLLDTAAIERVLRDGRPTLGEERSRLLGLLEAEAWAGHWCERLSSGARSRR